MWVYAEEVFLLNVLMDALLLAGTGRIEALRLRPLSILAAACLGGGWSLASLGTPLLAGTAGRILLSGAMVWTAWPHLPWRRRAETWAVFWGLTFVGGGAMAALAAGGASPWASAAVAAAALCLPGCLVLPSLRRRGMDACRVALAWNGVPLTGYVDTGCTAAEPVSGLPVLVVDAGWAARHLPAPEGRGRTVPLVTVQGMRPVRGYRAEGLRRADGRPLGDAWYVLGEGPLAGHADILLPGCWERSMDDGGGMAAEMEGILDRTLGALRRRGVLHRRERRDAAASAGGGGTGSIGGPGAGGCSVPESAHRAQSASGGVHRPEV